MSVKRSPLKALQPSTSKRNLDQISPETPVSKKMSTSKGMESMKLSDMTLEQLVSVLATKNDFFDLKREMCSLKEENKQLTNRVESLTQKCNQMETEIQSLYIWKNSSNLIIKVNRDSADVDTAKKRVLRICSELSEEQNTVEQTAIKELKSNDQKKYTFKIFFNQPKDATSILKNTGKLRGSDVSIAKDLPLVVRQQKSYLLQIRRFLIEKSSCRPRLQGHYLIADEHRLSWSLTENKIVVNNGESVENFLGNYQLTTADLDAFLRKQKQFNATAVNQRVSRLD